MGSVQFVPNSVPGSLHTGVFLTFREKLPTNAPPTPTACVCLCLSAARLFHYFTRRRRRRRGESKNKISNDDDSILIYFILRTREHTGMCGEVGFFIAFYSLERSFERHETRNTPSINIGARAING